MSNVNMKKAKMSEEKMQLLAAAKSFDADVERAEYIRAISECVFRKMCERCDKMSVCNPSSEFDASLYCDCRMAAFASVAVGMMNELPKIDPLKFPGVDAEP